MKIIGIDYGDKRVGVAVSDKENKIAFPKKVLENDSIIIEKIKSIAKKEETNKIIIGESKDFKMRDNPIMDAIRSFKEQLQGEGFDVKLHPEALSSHQVAKMMGEKNKMIDASAAAIILQSYLDSKML